jgi:hypothetical protein
MLYKTERNLIFSLSFASASMIFLINGGVSDRQAAVAVKWS